MRKLLISISFLLMIIACEDPVDVELSGSVNAVVIDALINDLPEDQRIVITRSGSYLEENSIEMIENANVKINGSDGTEYIFNHSEEGNYILSANEVDFKTMTMYTLSVELGSETFTGTTSLRRVPNIDSLVWRKESVAPFGIDVDSIIYAQFYATDLGGVGDRYWVRGFRNDSLINRDGFLRAWDASPGPGIEFDNVPFAQPIRQVVTPNGTEFGEILEVGDKITVKLFSISKGLANYFQIITEQINNGGLFATPPANIPTNLTKLSNGNDGLGWFEISNASSVSATINQVPGQAVFE